MGQIVSGVQDQQTRPWGRRGFSLFMLSPCAPPNWVGVVPSFRIVGTGTKVGENDSSPDGIPKQGEVHEESTLLNQHPLKKSQVQRTKVLILIGYC